MKLRQLLLLRLLFLALDTKAFTDVPSGEETFRYPEGETSYPRQHKGTGEEDPPPSDSKSYSEIVLPFIESLDDGLKNGSVFLSWEVSPVTDTLPVPSAFTSFKGRKLSLPRSSAAEQAQRETPKDVDSDGESLHDGLENDGLYHEDNDRNSMSKAFNENNKSRSDISQEELIINSSSSGNLTQDTLELENGTSVQTPESQEVMSRPDTFPNEIHDIIDVVSDVSSRNRTHKAVEEEFHKVEKQREKSFQNNTDRRTPIHSGTTLVSFEDKETPNNVDILLDKPSGNTNFDENHVFNEKLNDSNVLSNEMHNPLQEEVQLASEKQKHLYAQKDKEVIIDTAITPAPFTEIQIFETPPNDTVPVEIHGTRALLSNDDHIRDSIHTVTLRESEKVKDRQVEGKPLQVSVTENMEDSDTSGHSNKSRDDILFSSINDSEKIIVHESTNNGSASAHSTWLPQNDKENISEGVFEDGTAKSIADGNLFSNKYQNSTDSVIRNSKSNHTVNDNKTHTSTNEKPISEVQESIEIKDASTDIILKSSDNLTTDVFVRKCCEDHQYFSLVTSQCEDAPFDPEFRKALQSVFLTNSTTSFGTLNGRLPLCPGTTVPPNVSIVNIYDHSIHPLGYINDRLHGIHYDHDHYCLELATDNHDALQTAPIVLAHCIPKIRAKEGSKIYDNRQITNKSNLDQQGDSSEENTLLRKCCEDHQFFNLVTSQCEDVLSDPKFTNIVRSVLLPNSTTPLETLNGRLPICPGTTIPPSVAAANKEDHSIQSIGHIFDAANGVTYDLEHYCMELAAHSAGNLQEGVLVLAHCMPSDSKVAKDLITTSSIRKCCKEFEFFNTRSQKCETLGDYSSFLDAVREKLLPDDSSSDLNYITGDLMECPTSGEVPQHVKIAFDNHIFLPNGHLLDKDSMITYNHDHYCLELFASSHGQLDDGEIYLTSCMPQLKEDYKVPQQTIVRKCCADNEYFSTRTQECVKMHRDANFDSYVLDILEMNSTNKLAYRNGMIHWCSSSQDKPVTYRVFPHSYVISVFGNLQQLHPPNEYDHENYCVELAADSPELDHAVFVAFFCPEYISNIIQVRKCCGVNQYFDSNSKDCHDRLENMKSYSYLISDFLHPEPGQITITEGRLTCKHALMKELDTDMAYIDRTGELCEHANGVCHPPTAYCIEHFGGSSDSTLFGGAFVCPEDVFNKCCPPNEILTEAGCVKPNYDYLPSSPLNQLKEIFPPRVGFPTSNGKYCERITINSSKHKVRWLVKRKGFLSVSTEHGEITTENYCVDDYEENEAKKDHVLITCTDEVQHILPLDMLGKQGSTNTIGKCCPHGHHLQNLVCVQDLSPLNILSEPEFKDFNISDIIFTSFPNCPISEIEGFHPYPFGQRSNEDYATLGAYNIMKIISLDNGCYLTEQTVRNNDYCIDYNMVDGKALPMILSCPVRWDNLERYQEKYSITAVLLGISCTALIATALSLISMRVRRGMVTVKKVNTLAGRILLSYVLSYLLAFLLLAIGMKAKPEESGYACSVLAGFLTFFLLAAFQWNTSICLESLLLTLRVSTSERSRYLLHSLWAWGVPGIITAVALTLDHHKDSLPCSVVIPRIGLYRCFFSDRTAQLLYLYLPMLISLCANMILLMAAKYVRSAKLKRLEHGGRARKMPSGVSPEVTELQEQNKNSDQQSSSQNSNPSNNHQQHSGLRTHQTRNLWTESMKLVVWSGATWMAEVASFILTRFVTLSESWYNYLWYLPSSVNSLRGVGIFVILVLTPENRHMIFKMMGKLGSWGGSGSMARHSRSEAHSTSGNHHQSSVSHARTSDPRVPKKRNMSVATTLTQLSSIRSGESSEGRPETSAGKVHPKLAYSVSQIDTRRGSASSQSSADSYDGDSESILGNRRKTSLANFGLVSLPSVDEEDDTFEGTSRAPDAEAGVDTTQTTSEV